MQKTQISYTSLHNAQIRDDSCGKNIL